MANRFFVAFCSISFVVSLVLISLKGLGVINLSLWICVAPSVPFVFAVLIAFIFLAYFKKII